MQANYWPRMRSLRFKPLGGGHGIPQIPRARHQWYPSVNNRQATKGSLPTLACSVNILPPPGTLSPTCGVFIFPPSFLCHSGCSICAAIKFFYRIPFFETLSFTSVSTCHPPLCCWFFSWRRPRRVSHAPHVGRSHPFVVCVICWPIFILEIFYLIIIPCSGDVTRGIEGSQIRDTVFVVKKLPELGKKLFKITYIWSSMWLIILIKFWHLQVFYFSSKNG